MDKCKRLKANNNCLINKIVEVHNSKDDLDKLNESINNCKKIFNK